MSQNQPVPDIAQSLEEMGETISAAELVRKQGQSKKVRVINERKLTEWIERLLRQQLAGREDTYSDQQKQEMIDRLQQQLQQRITREKEANAERDRKQRELDQVMQVLSNAQSSQGDQASALAALRAKLEEKERLNEDLQQDLYELQDSLQEKINLLSSTIAEKDRLNATVRGQMTRSTALIESVLGLDQNYYAGRHAEASPVNEDASPEEGFYHDFAVAASVTTTLAGDLERLRGIAAEVATRKHEGPQLLERDLALLASLKSGSLAAVDVAAPVAGLVEALSGVREETEALNAALASATGGAARSDAIAELPDADGDPATVLAGSTSVARELATALARNRNRLAGLTQLAEQADSARQRAEEDLDRVRAEFDRVLAVLARRGGERGAVVPISLTDAKADPAVRAKAGVDTVDALAAAGASQGAAAAMSAGLDELNRILGSAGSQPVVAASINDPEDIASAHRRATAVLEQHLSDARQEVALAAARERALADQVRVLAAARADQAGAGAPTQLQASVRQLDQIIAAPSAQPTAILAATQAAVAALAAQSAADSGAARGELREIERLRSELAAARRDTANVESRLRAKVQAERDVAQEVVRAAQGDDRLADQVADLSLALDQGSGAHALIGNDDANQLASLRQAVAQLGARKSELADELAQVRRTHEQTLARQASRDVEVTRLSKELAIANERLATLTATASDQAELSASAAAKHQAAVADLARQRSELAERDRRLAEAEAEAARLRQTAEAERNQAADAHARRSALESEKSRLAGLLASAEQNAARLEGLLAEARSAISGYQVRRAERRASEREIATRLVEAAQGDAVLAERSADLAMLLEESRPGEAAPALTPHLLDGVADLARRKSDLEAELAKAVAERDATAASLATSLEQARELASERDEMAASGKEVIARITEQKDARERDLAALRSEHADLVARNADAVRRALTAEGANRQLAESLAALAATESKDDQSGLALPGVEDPRVDLELALSQLPAEGEAGVQVSADVSQQIADSGQRLAEALVSRRKAATQAFTRSRESASSLKAQMERVAAELAAARAGQEASEAEARRHQAETQALRSEMSEQAQTLATKIQEVASARSELLTLRADHHAASERLRDAERKLALERGAHASAEHERDTLRTELSTASHRAETAEANQLAIAVALRSLTTEAGGALADHDPSDPVSRAAQKLELAKAVGGEHLAAAGTAFADAVRGRVTHLADSLRGVKHQLSERSGEIARLSGELTGMRAALVDRDHDLDNLRAEVDRMRADVAESGARIAAAARERDVLAGELAREREQNRAALAELDEFRARGTAAGDLLGAELGTMQQRLATAEQTGVDLRGEIAQLREKLESAEARARRTREELSKRLEERDRLLQQKDAELDARGERGADRKALEAQLAALSAQLKTAGDRIVELEAASGAVAGTGARGADLARELKRTQADRDALREDRRRLEADMADLAASLEDFKTQAEERRRELHAQRDQTRQEVAEERARAAAHAEELRKAKEENVGLRAKLRRFTETGGTAAHRKG